MFDEKYMHLALEEANKAYLEKEVPVGAIIELNGKIIASAHNEKNKTNISTKHAEIIAIESACRQLNTWRLDGAIMYVTLEPCPMCASAIRQSRITNVVYGASRNSETNFQLINQIFQSISNDPPVHFIGYYCYDECKKIMDQFFKNQR